MSPMTTWLRGGRTRGFRARPISPLMSGARVSVVLTDNNEALAAGAGQTVEEAMANALNALMAQQGEENANK